MIPFKSFLTQFGNLDSDVRKIFYDFFTNENPFLVVAESHWRPNVDIYDTSQGIVVKVELSGVKQDEISVVYEDNKLKIKGHRSDYSIPDKVSCHQIEINYGDFERVINLEYANKKQVVDVEKINATYKDGMMIVFLPYKNNPKQDNIKIEIQGEE